MLCKLVITSDVSVHGSIRFACFLSIRLFFITSSAATGSTSPTTAIVIATIVFLITFIVITITITITTIAIAIIFAVFVTVGVTTIVPISLWAAVGIAHPIFKVIVVVVTCKQTK